MTQEIPEQLLVGQIRQKALLIKDGNKILVSRDIGHAKWDLPGGRLHVGEDPKEGLAREVKEEIGVEIEVGRPLFTASIPAYRETKVSFMVLHEAHLKNPAQEFVLAPDEIEEVRWVTKEEALALPMWDEYKRALKAHFG